MGALSATGHFAMLTLGLGNSSLLSGNGSGRGMSGGPPSPPGPGSTFLGPNTSVSCSFEVKTPRHTGLAHSQNRTDDLWGNSVCLKEAWEWWTVLGPSSCSRYMALTVKGVVQFVGSITDPQVACFTADLQQTMRSQGHISNMLSHAQFHQIREMCGR
jgi:hypothetical protein